VAGLAAAEALVVRGDRVALAAVRALRPLDDHTATEESHPVAVLDRILGIARILILDESIT
jgi:NAD(P)-dependent dehydrogenase (short-subunit alcohol dehydrogenase family)